MNPSLGAEAEILHRLTRLIAQFRITSKYGVHPLADFTSPNAVQVRIDAQIVFDAVSRRLHRGLLEGPRRCASVRPGRLTDHIETVDAGAAPMWGAIMVVRIFTNVRFPAPFGPSSP